MTTQPLSGLPVVWSADCLLHEPDGEVWLGVWETGTEVPERARVPLTAVTEAGATVNDATPHDTTDLTAVHDAELVEHLATIWAQWQAGGYDSDHGRSRVVPYVFPTPGLLGDLPMRSPAATHGRAGRFCYDTMTLVGPGSWEAINGRRRRGADRRRPRCGGRRDRLRALQAARTPHDQVCLRRILLPEQRRDRGTGVARLGRRRRRCNRHRRPPRKRHPGDLLRPARRLLRQRARRSGRWLVPALRRVRRRTRDRRGRGRQPQSAARAGHRRRRLARGGERALRRRPPARRGRCRRLARRRRRRR